MFTLAAAALAAPVPIPAVEKPTGAPAAPIETLAFTDPAWGRGGQGYAAVVLEGGARLAGRPADPSDFGTVVRCADATPWHGRGIALTGRLRPQHVKGWTGLWARVDGPDGRIDGFDNMQAHELHGTHPWTRATTAMLPVPEDAVQICFGVLLRGSGAVVVDEVTLVEGNMPVWTPADLDDAAVERLRAIGRLWATIRYFSPGFARSGVGFEPLVAAVDAARADADLAEVARNLVASVPGQAWVGDRQGPAASTTTDASGALVVVPGETPDFPEHARLVVDLRGGVGLSDAWKAALAQGNPALPRLESMRWIGFPSPEEPRSIYRLERPRNPGRGRLSHAGPTADRVVLVVDARTDPTLVSALIALQDAGATVVGVGLAGADDAWVVPLAPGLDARVAKRAPVRPLVPDLPGGEDPVATALAWLADPRPPPARPREEPALIPPLPVTDPAVRLAGVLTAWTTFGTFSPYWDDVDVDWEAELGPALREAGAVTDRLAWRDGLARFVGRAHDGHSFVAVPRAWWGLAYPELALLWAEEQVVVVRAEGTAAAAGIAPGQIVDRIDGADARARMDALAELQSGTRLEERQMRALTRALAGAEDVPLRLTVHTGDEEPHDVDVPRASRNDLWDLPPLETGSFVDDDLLYVKVSDVDLGKLRAELARARGLIVDGRDYPGDGAYDIFRRFAEEPVWTQHFMTPVRTGPGPTDFTWDEGDDWNVKPRGRHLDIPVVFLADARAMSQAELYLEMAREAHLGPIIGEATAGVDGNISTFGLPDGSLVMFTAMRCTNQDGTPFHTIGVQPDVVVHRTLAGVGAGRDEVLDAAVAWIRTGSAWPPAIAP